MPCSRLLVRTIFLACLGATAALGQEPAAEPKVNVAAEPEPEAGAAPAATERPNPPARPAGTIDRTSILRLFTQANPMLWPLAICSVVTLGFTLERLLALRRSRVIPRDFVNRFHERLSGGKLDRERAAELCRANESPAARVLAEVVRHWGQPAAVIRQAVGQGAGGEVLDLKRNIRVLNGTSTLAPLLGLLGTVVGMIESFDALGGKVGPARGEALAQGISLALVTTALGLGIAVLSVTAYYYLLNRVDLLVRELDDEARKAIDLIAGEPARPIPDRRSVDMARQDLRGY